MNKKIIVAPSVLSADFSEIRQALDDIKTSGAEWVHLDVMDGSFVPNITFGSKFIADIRKHSDLFFDAHLMVREPQNHIEEFAKAGCQAITIHSEAVLHLDRALNRIKTLGVKAGVAIVPSTPVSMIEPVLGLVDIVLVMTVNPGFGGQSMIPYTLDKVRQLVELRKDRQYVISVDGGISDRTIVEASQAGIDVAVAGSAFFASEDKKGFVNRMSEGYGRR